MTEHEQNLRTAERLCADFAWQGRFFRQGDCVALLDGKIIAVAANPDDAIAMLRIQAPSPNRGMVVELTPSAVDVIR